MSIANNFYVYHYLRSSDGTPFYVGKGSGSRAFEKHFGRRAPSRDRIVFIAKNLTEQAAFDLEILEIKRLGRKDLGTGILRNLTDGGEGPSGMVLSEESRGKMSASRTGKALSVEHRANISAAKIGKPVSDEARAKMSAAKIAAWAAIRRSSLV